MHALHATGEVIDRMITRLLKVHTGEVAMTTMGGFTGLWLLSPGNPQTDQGYIALSAVMPTHVWGTVSIVVGFSFIVARILKSRRGFAGASLASAVWWAFMAVAYGTMYPSSLAIPVFSSIALTSVVAFMKGTAPIRHEEA